MDITSKFSPFAPWPAFQNNSISPLYLPTGCANHSVPELDSTTLNIDDCNEMHEQRKEMHEQHTPSRLGVRTCIWFAIDAVIAR